MSLWSRISAGAAAVARPLGTLVAAATGRSVARARAPSRDNTRTVAFTIGVIALSAKMAVADGAVTRDEVAAFKRLFPVPDAEIAHVDRVFSRAGRDAGNFEPYARQIARLFEPGSAVLEDLLLCLFVIAKADRTIRVGEIDYLRRVAEIFGFDEAEFERIRAAELGAGTADPYAVLGLAPGAGMDEVRAAYRRLAGEHHPDRLLSKGLPPVVVGIATAKMASINAAYARIRQRHAAG